MTRDNDHDARLRTQVRLLGEDSLNVLDKARWEDLRRREQWAAKREQDTVAQLRAEMHGEFARLRDELEQRREVATEAVGTFVGETFDKLLDKTELAARDLQRDLFTLVEKRFAELGARLDVMSGTPASKKGFRFASEPAPENEPVDLPGFLQYKTTLN
jgi:hypothetical protein